MTTIKALPWGDHSVWNGYSYAEFSISNDNVITANNLMSPDTGLYMSLKITLQE